MTSGLLLAFLAGLVTILNPCGTAAGTDSRRLGAGHKPCRAAGIGRRTGNQFHHFSASARLPSAMRSGLTRVRCAIWRVRC